MKVKEVMGYSEARASAPWGAFVFHSINAALGPVIVLLIAAWCLSFAVNSQTAEYLTLGPTYSVPIISGFAIGFLVAKFSDSRAQLWAWVLPVLLLLLFILLGLLNADTRGSVWMNLFGPSSKCADICVEQLAITAPALGAIAYSCGAWISHHRRA
jgi:uncharacterized protein YacL